MIRTAKKYFKYFAPSWKWLLISLCCALLGSLCNILIPRFISMIADAIEAGMNTRIDSTVISDYAKYAVFLIWGSVIFGFIKERVIAIVGQNMNLEMRRKMNEKIDSIRISVLDQKSIGDVMNRCVSDVNSYAQIFSSNVNLIITCLVIIIGCIIMMIALNWLLAIVSISILIMGFLIAGRVTAVSQTFFVKDGTINMNINAYVQEILNGHVVVKAFANEEQVKKRFAEQVEQQKKQSLYSQWLSGLLQQITSFTGNMAYVVVCIIGVILYLHHFREMTLGVIVAFILYVKMIAGPLNQLAQSVSAIQPAFAAADRLFDFLDSADNPNEVTKHFDDVKGQVTFEHVKFGYNPEHVIIHDFNAVIQPGMKVAIVGPTGAGKTTLVNLLMRFYELNGGCIKIDGVPIDQIPRQELHNTLGMVLQETWTFEGTLRDNIIYSTPDVSEERLESVLKKTGLNFMAETMQDGIDTVISEQMEISAGQKQLITIARAMIKDPTVLILDEATSSIDTRTEKLLQESIDELTSGRTSFVIAHRLSTIQNADMIFVMKDGDVVEVGNHEELLKQKGLYSELYYSQFDTE